MDSYQLVVIGAGPGGYVAAIRAAQLGMNVALIEKADRLGGTCLNVGCIPSKALLQSSELYWSTRHKAREHGISVGEVSFDLETMMSRKDGIVAELTGGLSLLMKKNKITVHQGQARLAGAGRVAISGEQGGAEVAADAILLATGSEPVELPSMPFDGKRIVNSTDALCFPSVPKHLVVVGAGAVGLELGSVWLRLGARVTVVELMPSILPFADGQLAQFMQRSLKKLGMEFILGAQVTGAEKTRSGVKVSIKDGKDKATSLACDRLLIAVGRRPFSKGLGLAEAGVQLDEKGRVKVDERFQTSLPRVYAIGDLIEGPMLAHKAEEEGVALAETLAGKAGHVNYDAIPNVVYTWPELAQVGMTEAQAGQKGLDCRVGKYYYKSNGRAKCMGETDGLVKMVADARTDRLLGAGIVGAQASEMIAEIALALEFQASAEDVARTVHAHPTLSEIIKEAALAVDRRSIHG